MKVWYDSDCGVCTWFTQFIESKSLSPISFIKSASASSFPPGISREVFVNLSKKTLILESSDGGLLTHHLAIAQLLKHLPFPYKGLYYLIIFPGLSWCFWLGYMGFSRFRFFLSFILGKGACRL